MSGQKCHALAFKFAHNEVVGRLAERCVDGDLLRVRQARHLIETAATNDTNRYSFQCPSKSYSVLIEDRSIRAAGSVLMPAQVKPAQGLGAGSALLSTFVAETDIPGAFRGR